MNLSSRSKLSLCQFLDLFGRDYLALLFGKYDLSTDDLKWGGQSTIASLQNAILAGYPSQLGELINEISRTRNSMRFDVSPRYRFDDRWNDLKLCLELDGYAKERDGYDRELDRFVPIEPRIEGAEPVEDDLAKEIRQSRLPRADGILRVVEHSSDAFRSRDYNGCLTNARVALQTLATEIAKARQANHPGSFDDSKWGQVVAYLRTSGLITQQQEEGLTGVYSFVSPGAHTPVGFSEQEFARLGRSLAVSLCYFLTKTFNAGE